MRPVPLIVLAGAAALVFGCGESRQQKFERALHTAEVARVDLETARLAVAEAETRDQQARAAAEQAASELAAARARFESASGRFASARAEVLKWAPEGAPPTQLDAATPKSDAPPAPAHPN